MLHVISSTDPATAGPIDGILQMGPVLTELGVDVEIVCSDTPDATCSMTRRRQ